MALLAVEEALAAIVAKAKPLQDHERVPLLDSGGRVLAEDILAAVDVPPCDNSAMDGYAFCWADLKACNSSPSESELASSQTDPIGGSHRLPISQRIIAGAAVDELEPGTAARIFTGAPIPLGADTVVMQEDVRLESDCLLIDRAKHHKGQNIRLQGQDIQRGAQVLAAGRRVLAQDIGLIASLGAVDVAVIRRLKVAVISTGNELVEPGETLQSGQIYNSNRYLLTAMLQAMGCEVIDGGIVADNFQQTCDTLLQLSERADVVISSGGVSVGEEDHIKPAVEALGQLDLWKLNMKPGKPLAFGSIGSTPFFGLPGNPASVFVTFCLLARPFLQRRQGQVDVTATKLMAGADFDWQRAGSRQEYLRARMSLRGARLVVEKYPNQSSGVLMSTSWANCLAVIPPHSTFKAGQALEVMPLSELLA